MILRLSGLGALAAVLVLGRPAAACVPGCSGYHLQFVGPAPVSTADRSVTVAWSDALDGATATFDLLASSTPIPVYEMHSFPAELPGQVLALGLAATGGGVYTWSTAGVPEGTYLLYAVFHNPPFDTLVLPFAAVAISHGSPAVAPLVLVQSPRGQNAASGTQTIDVAIAPGTEAASLEVLVGSPPLADDGTPVGPALPLANVSAGAVHSVTWDSTGVSGAKVFKAVVRAADGTVLASALSPGQVLLGEAAAPAPNCSVGLGVPGLAGLLIVLFGVRQLAPRRVGR